MIATGSRESVIQNLEDAGCETEMIQNLRREVKMSKNCGENAAYGCTGICHAHLLL